MTREVIFKSTAAVNLKNVRDSGFAWQTNLTIKTLINVQYLYTSPHYTLSITIIDTSITPYPQFRQLCHYNCKKLRKLIFSLLRVDSILYDKSQIFT